MVKKTVVISFALLVLLAACQHKDEDGRSTFNPTYFIDPQTELCFAFYDGISHVPCTDKVKEQIGK